MLYLPGSGTGQVLAREAAGWSVILDDVPPYCTDVVFVEGQLLLVGEKDWNVPVVNSEQLYLALKRLGVRFADGSGYSDTSGFPLSING